MSPSTSSEFEPDWGDYDMIDEIALDATPALRHDLEKEVGPTTAGALLGDMEQQDVRGPTTGTAILKYPPEELISEA